jgi:hypothetical protein
MTEKDMAFEIAQKVIQMEAEIEALRQVLNRSWPPENDPWPQFVRKGADQLLAHETYRQRFADIRSSFDAASHDTRLIRTLHEGILRRTKVPE